MWDGNLCLDQLDDIFKQFYILYYIQIVINDVALFENLCFGNFWIDIFFHCYNSIFCALFFFLLPQLFFFFLLFSSTIENSFFKLLQLLLYIFLYLRKNPFFFSLSLPFNVLEQFLSFFFFLRTKYRLINFLLAIEYSRSERDWNYNSMLVN